MDSNIFNLENFNIIEDEENYYFFRALNMADNQDLETGTTLGKEGNIERIRTDRERYDGKTKYTEDSKLTLEEIYDHIKMHYRKDTNCISLTSNSNVAVNYGRGSYKDKYVMIKIPKKEFGEKTVSAGQYMLQELYARVQQEVENLPEKEKGQILSVFDDIEDAKEIKTLQDIIEHIKKNGFRIEPEIVSRQSGKGIQLSESVNLNLQKEEQSLMDEIKKLSSEELDIVLQNGGLYNARDIITKTFSNISENEKIDKVRYYAEAIVSQYNWQNIGIEEIKIDEKKS